MSEKSEVEVQFPNSAKSLAKTIRDLLSDPKLVEVRIAVAFARWDGIGLISDELDSFLEGGGKYQTIFGVENGVTTPDALLHCLYLQSQHQGYSFAGAIEPEFRNSLFHTKLFEFNFGDRIQAFVGSANLTGAGLERNTELVAHIHCPTGSKVANGIDSEWQRLVKAASKIDAAKIQNWHSSGVTGREDEDSDSKAKHSNLPALTSKFKKAKKPLFNKLLGSKKKAKKVKILKSANVLTEKPDKLYLQILPYETGGSGGPNGSAGYQVQLPVAVLSAYFGVGVNQTKEISVQFPSETIQTKLTHFSNNTHRIRLKPILKVKRPNILVFSRIGEDSYKAKFVGQARYKKTLEDKCKEQSRVGARRWGFA